MSKKKKETLKKDEEYLKAEARARENTKEIGMMIVAKLMEFGFNEKEMEDIFTASAENEANKILIRRKAEKKEEASKKKNTET